MLTQQELKSVLLYKPDTGEFFWKYRSDLDSQWNSKYAGTRAGFINELGYWKITLGNTSWLAHRLAFLYMTGKIPDLIDHKDQDKSNTKWDNLRIATVSQNQANAKLRVDNTSGYKNVTWHKQRNKWKVEVCKDGKLHYGGLFTELDKAVNKANNLRRELFGEFAVYEEFIG